MKKNKTVVGVIGALVIIASFYAGVKYGQSKTPVFGQGGMNGSAFNTAGRQARIGMGGEGTRTAGGGFLSGDIISIDAKSMVLKLRDGSSKIVFFSGTTQFMKAVSGSVQDLAVGKQVSTTGTANSDGSVNAESIQIRPEVKIVQ